MGWKSKSLRLRIEPTGRTGNELWLLNETRTKIHDLALECEVHPYDQGPSDRCPQCARRKHGPHPKQRDPS
jgi:hypothetical protein